MSKAVSSRSFLLCWGLEAMARNRAGEISRTIHGTYMASLLESLCMSLLSGCIFPPATMKTYLLRQRSCRPTSRGRISPSLPSDQTIRLSLCQRETPHDDGLAQVSSLIGLLPFT